MPDLAAEILSRLKSSPCWTSKTKIRGNHIQELCCSVCHKNEAWAYLNNPFSINCNRKNECGARTRTLELFPEILENIEKENPPTKEDQHRPARVYLMHRGLNRSLDGLRFEYWRDIRETGSGGVMFFVGRQGKKEVWNGRLFNPPRGEGKTHNVGSTAGLYWKHSGIKYDPAQTTYVTEGIIDALSLIEMGFQAIAILAAGQDLTKLDLKGLGLLVPAFDCDSAGAGGLKKWSQHLAMTNGSIVPIKGDWNDLLVSRSIEDARRYFEEKQDEFKVRARLLLAESAQEYAETYQGFYRYPPGLFSFDGSYYFASMVRTKKAESLSCQRVSNFTLKVDHFQKDVSMFDEPVFRYCLKVKPRKNRPMKFTISGNELGSADGLTKILLTRGKVLWEGNRVASMALAKKIVEAESPEVRLLPTIGYDEESQCYVFQHFVIDKAGRFVEPDKSGFFRIAGNERLRAGPYATLKPRNGIAAANIYNTMSQAWPQKAEVAIAWMVATWFVHLIKREIGFFPFLSLYEDTQTGKSNLSRAMNRMQCFDEEGLPLTKVNTSKGEVRKLAQRVSLFKALLEGKKEERIRFDYDSVLTLYNENPLQIRAQTSNDIQTNEVPFRSAIMFVQNKNPFHSRAQNERVISLQFFQHERDGGTTRAFEDLLKIPPAQLASFFCHVMQHRKNIEDRWVDEFGRARDFLRGRLDDPRITENHAVVLAFHWMLAGILGLKRDVDAYVVDIAKKKAEECQHRQETLADNFFIALDQLEHNLKESEIDSFREIREGKLYIVLQEAIKLLRSRQYDLGYTEKLRDDLRNHPAFIESNKVVRGYFGRTVTCTKRVWIFDVNHILGAEVTDCN